MRVETDEDDGRASTLWSDDWQEPTERGDRRRWWLVAAVAPWLVVLGVFLRPDGPGGRHAVADDGAVAPSAQPSADDRAAGGADDTDAVGADGAGAGADDMGGVGADDADGGSAGPIDAVVAAAGRATDDLGHAVAVAAAAARAWVTGVGPTLAVGDLQGRDRLYLEHLVLEGVDHPAPGAAVVTFAAVVLRAAGERYDRATARRVAVPLRLPEGEPPALAGEPWWLAGPEPRVASDPPTTPVEDPQRLADAGAAIGAAGYGEVTVESLARTDGWPWTVSFTGRAPGEDDARRRRLWLRPHLGGFVVAGATPPPSPAVAP